MTSKNVFYQKQKNQFQAILSQSILVLEDIGKYMIDNILLSKS